MGITGKQMAEKADIAYQDKWGYIWATAGIVWTEKRQSDLKAKYESDPVKYADYEQGAKNGKKWIGHKVADCSGLIKWAATQLGLKGVYHGSNSMFNKNCRKVEKIQKGVKIPIGAVIFTGTEKGQHNHVGILVSETHVCEARSTAYGVVHTLLSNKKWTYWGLLNGVEYDETMNDEVIKNTKKKQAAESAKKEEAVKTEKKYTYPTLRKGAKGDLVFQMQSLLQKDGSTLEIDGIFGVGTLSAVKSFQKRHGLVVDGIVGPKTWAELLKLA